MAMYILVFAIIGFLSEQHMSVTGLIPCDDEGWIFQCLDGNCINDIELCDGYIDCPDGSDERNYANVTSEEGHACTRWNQTNETDKCFLPQKHVCDQYNNCMEDECDCPNNPTFRCSPSECIHYDFFCDGYLECTNGADEIIYRHPNDGVKCWTPYSGTACALPFQYRCDGIRDCVPGGDECFCGSSQDGEDEYDDESIFDQTCFRCLDGLGEMVSAHLCNGYFECDDLSDECLCENPPSTCKQLRYSDECEFECRNIGQGNKTKCIKKKQVCDNNRDCFFGEDEKYCAHVHTFKLNLDRHYGEDEPEMWCCNAGYPADCLFEETFTNETFDGCDQFYVCPEDVLFLPYMTYAKKCDGIPTCIGYNDECLDCDYSDPPLYCAADQKYGFVCPNDALPVPILLPDLCDGFPTCNTSSPMDSADEINCTDRFYCLTDIDGVEHISINLAKVCDCRSDCRDGSDEEHCEDWSNFCCRNGEEAVSKYKVCNGVDDCNDGSDECQSCIQSPFADDENLISNKVLRAFVWIIGILSSAGNVYVLIHTSLILYRGKQNDIMKITSMYIIALSVADLCVGIYLICLGIVNAVYSGKYCHEDAAWRSGNVCNFLGVFLTFGMEASVMMLSVMTLYRLYIVSSPFKLLNIRTAATIMSVLLFSALLLAVVPVFPTLEDYFITHVRLQKNPFLGRNIDATNFSEFANKLASYGTEQHDFRSILGERRDVYTWGSLFNVMRHLNESFEPEYQFGYYSSSGVCLPKLFPEYTDPSWQYSIFLIIVNFISFFVILLGYIAIYRQTMKTRINARKSNSQSDPSVAVQRKITRIIVTDFCCWMPICLIAFLKLGGIQVSDEVYAVAAIIILPINSAINPFLYSDLPDAILTRAGRAYSFMQSENMRSQETGNTHLEHNVNEIRETKT